MFDRGLAITEGAALAADDKEAVILGEGLAANLGAKTGDKVVLLVNAATGTLNAREFVVRGTFSSISKLYDDTGLRLPLASAQRLLRISGAQQWVVLLDDTDKTAATLEALRGVLPKARFALTRWDDEADFYHKTAQLFARQFGFIRVVVTAIIVLSILNTMTMNVLERTWEIGVMLALGDSRRQVLALFACEGALLGFAGGLLGAALGLVVAAVLNALGIPMPAPPGMSHGFDAGVLVSAAQVATAFGIGCVAAAIASLPPAARASRLRVVDALRVTH
jgi:putative ABC transport system permease protein